MSDAYKGVCRETEPSDRDAEAEQVRTAEALNRLDQASNSHRLLSPCFTSLRLRMKTRSYFAFFLLALAACAFASQATAKSEIFQQRDDIPMTAGRMKSTDAPNLPESELGALAVLYDATQGDEWLWRPLETGAHWNFSNNPNPCVQVWQGINCTFNATEQLYHVETLQLDSYNLNGFLPYPIVKLVHLTILNLNNNKLRGFLSPHLGNLTQLQQLALFDNQLSGPLPESIVQMRQLQRFNIYSNRIWGSLPQGIGNLTQLQIFSAYYNQLTGTLPDSLGCLTNLTTLNLNQNHIQGSIPASIGDLTKLTLLDLSSCALSQTIPSSIGNLARLQALNLYDNALTGEIPTSLGNLNQLNTINLYYNNLVGTIPESLFTLSELGQLEIYDNFLDGTIPANVGNLKKVKTLGLNSNRLRGTIPQSIGNCSQLLRLYLDKNLLTGTIPDSMANLTHLEYLNLYVNTLSGTIPSFLGSLRSLVDFGLDTNHFHGTLPDSLGNLNLLRSFYVNSNALSKTIPASLSNLNLLQGMFLQDNQFSGSVPSFLATMPLLRDIEIGENEFTGTIPAALGNLTQLQYLYMDELHLTGSIPVTLTQLTNLQYFSLSYNHLTGTIPSGFAALTQLRELQLQENHLSGGIEELFSTKQSELQTVLLAKNDLTGTLPAALFSLPLVDTVVLVGNCFHGKLPETVCDAKYMKSLILDGLSSATSCRDPFLPHVSSSYTIRQSVHGKIPGCLFMLPQLNTLHMSGNGLTGSLPHDIEFISSTLLSVSLSHNKITGAIPEIIQVRQWSNLDLSYNRIAGSLEPNFATQPVLDVTDDDDSGTLPAMSHVARRDTHARATAARTAREARITIPDRRASPMADRKTNVSATYDLSLENNRLSGKIPETLIDFKSISILGSNVFGCEVGQKDVPHNDNGRASYECGSIAFDIPYYIWISLAGVCGLTVLGLYWFRERVMRYEKIALGVRTFQKWIEFSSSKGEKVSLLNIFNNVIEVVCKITVCCGLFVLIILVPLYSGLSTRYGALTHQYAFGVSGAFLTGVVPMATEMAVLLFLMFLVIVVFARLITPRLRYESGNRHRKREAARMNKESKTEIMLKRTVISLVYFVVNLTVVIAVNVAYVYIAIYEDSAYHVLAQIALSLFKVVWNNVCTSIVLRSIVHFITTIQSTARDSKYSENKFVSLQIFVALVNNIAVPCLVVAVVSPSCFYSVFVPAPTVSSVYTYSYCSLFNVDTGDCTVYLPAHATSEYNPPFTYNFQCSFSLVTYYSPAFVSLCIVASFIAPAAQLLLQFCLRRTTQGTLLFRFLDAICPRILKPLPVELIAEASAERAEDGKSTSGSVNGDSSLSVQAMSDLTTGGSTLHRTMTGESNSTQSASTAMSLIVYEEQTYFKANQVLITLLTYLGLLLTFGVMFPPLGFAVMVTVLMWALFARIKVGRFLSTAMEARLPQFADIIEVECQGVGSVSVLQRAMWMLVTVSCWFYTLFLFDTIGDAMGFQHAYWVLIVMPLMPLILYIGFAVYTRRMQRAALAKGASTQDNEMELQVGVNMLLTAPNSMQEDDPRSLQGFVVPVVPTMGSRTTTATGEESLAKRDVSVSSTFNNPESEVHNVLRGRLGDARASIIEL